MPLSRTDNVAKASLPKRAIISLLSVFVLLDLELSYPKEMGGTGAATNPEQLFAAGYSACFSNAILHVAREGKATGSQSWTLDLPALTSATSTSGRMRR